MATVTLADLWIHDAADLDSSVRVYMGSLSETSSQGGEVRAYANGVSRSITVTGTRRTFAADLPYLARTDLTLLRSWVGRPVMVRDPLSRKLFGVYFTVDVSESPIGDPLTVLRASFDLTETSLTEAV